MYVLVHIPSMVQLVILWIIEIIYLHYILTDYSLPQSCNTSRGGDSGGVTW